MTDVRVRFYIIVLVLLHSLYVSNRVRCALAAVSDLNKNKI